MCDTVEMRFIDGHGREVVREVRLTANAEDLRGTAMFPFVIIAANPSLSVFDLERFLDLQAETNPGCARSVAWIRRRLWMARPPETSYRRNRDRRDPVAFRIMAEYPKASVRQLVMKLRERSIVRSREWVRKNRTAGVSV